MCKNLEHAKSDAGSYLYPYTSPRRKDQFNLEKPKSESSEDQFSVALTNPIL